MKQVTFKFSTTEDPTDAEVCIEFSSEDLVLLERFHHHAQRLASVAMIAGGYPQLSQISMNAQGLHIQADAIDYAKLAELLHVARAVFLAKEPSSFEKAAGIIGKRAANTVIARYLKTIHRIYREGPFQRYFQVTVSGTEVFHESTLLYWLNGVEYHQDLEKVAIVEKLKAALSPDGAQQAFVAQLQGRIEAVARLDRIAAIALK